MARTSLLNCDGRRQTRNITYCRLLHLVNKLPCIRTQRFNIFPASLSIDRIKSQRTFTASADTGYNNHFIARNININTFKIMLGGTGY